MSEKSIPSWLENRIEERAKQDALKDFLQTLQKEGVEIFNYKAILEKNERYLTYFGGMILGLFTAIITIILNFLIFVWLLHLEF